MRFEDVKPALRFLGVFLGSYLLLSLLYAYWIESRGGSPDGMTVEVSRQVVGILRLAGVDARQERNPDGPTVQIFEGPRRVLNVFEGCNGINVMIVFLAFVLAFGGQRARIAWFIPLGFLVIHVANLMRILWLFWLSSIDARLFYYFHKYFFTGVIYVIVFGLWWGWVTKWSARQNG